MRRRLRRPPRRRRRRFFQRTISRNRAAKTVNECGKIMIFKLCELRENWLKLLEKILLSCQLLENSIYTKKKISKEKKKI